MFGKTAGCFNILKREHEISKESALVVTAKPVTVRNPNLKLQDYARHFLCIIHYLKDT